MNFLTSIHPERSRFRLQRAGLKPHKAYFRPKRNERPEKPERPERVDLWSWQADFGLKRADFGPFRA